MENFFSYTRNRGWDADQSEMIAVTKRFIAAEDSSSEYDDDNDDDEQVSKQQQPTKRKIITLSIVSLVFFFSFIVSSVRTDPSLDSKNSVIYIKSTEELERFTTDHAMAFINFCQDSCQWCERISPTWQTLQTKLQNSTVTIASVDCTHSPHVCEEQFVTQYPSLRWYDEGQYRGLTYDLNDTSLCALERYVHDKIQEHDSEAKVKEEDLITDMDEIENGVMHGTDGWSDQVFVNYYTPTSVWSQRLQPTWEQIIAEFSDTPSLRIISVDCTKDAKFCQDQHVTNFPSLRWYDKGGRQGGTSYRGDVTVCALRTFVEMKMAEYIQACMDRYQQEQQQWHLFQPGYILASFADYMNPQFEFKVNAATILEGIGYILVTLSGMIYCVWGIRTVQEDFLLFHMKPKSNVEGSRNVYTAVPLVVV